MVLPAHALHLRSAQFARHVPHAAAEHFALPALSRGMAVERPDTGTGGISVAVAPENVPLTALAALVIVAVAATAVVRRKPAAVAARAPPARSE